MKLPRRHPVRNAALVASATALIGGGALALRLTGSSPSGHAAPTGVTAENAAVDTHDCDVIHNDLRTKNDSDIDTGDALKCDQREFAALEKARLSGKTDNRVRLSATCNLVDKRVAAGDLDVDDGLAEACRNRELFAFTTDVSNELGSSDRLTSMCVGKKKLDKTPEGSPAFEKKACTDKPFGRQPLPVSEKPIDPSPTPSSTPPPPVTSPTPSSSPTPNPADIFAKCDPLDKAVENKTTFDSAAAVECAKLEADPNQDGHPDRPATICFAVDQRASEGDLAMPVDLVLECRTQLGLQRTPLGSTQQETPTSICVTARQQEKNNVHVDPQLVAACNAEPA